MFGVKKFAQTCKGVGHILRAVVREEEGRGALRYEPMIQEDVCHVHRCGFRGQNSPSGFRVVARSDNDVLAPVVVIKSSPKIFIATKSMGAFVRSS